MMFLVIPLEFNFDSSFINPDLVNVRGFSHTGRTKKQIEIN